MYLIKHRRPTRLEIEAAMVRDWARFLVADHGGLVVVWIDRKNLDRLFLTSRTLQIDCRDPDEPLDGCVFRPLNPDGSPLDIELGLIACAKQTVLE